MSKMLKVVTISSLATVVGLSLVVGGITLTATPAQALACVPAPDGTSHLGEYPSDQACFEACFAIHGEDLAAYHWNTTTTCCSCVF